MFEIPYFNLASSTLDHDHVANGTAAWSREINKQTMCNSNNIILHGVVVGNKIVQFYGGQNKQYVLILARSTNYLMDFFIIILDYIHKYKGRNLVYGVGNKIGRLYFLILLYGQKIFYNAKLNDFKKYGRGSRAPKGRIFSIS